MPASISNKAKTLQVTAKTSQLSITRNSNLATHPFELTRLDSATFEHLVNSLAMRVLGLGVTGFAPGADAGRDGYFEGEAEYPSSTDRWNGVWYIQSKFMMPSLASNPQKWLQQQVNAELAAFTHSDSDRTLPDNWIIATNVDPSGAGGRGTFDKIKKAIREIDPNLAKRTHIWGGRKILDLLNLYPNVRRQYGSFLTSGDVISSIVNSFSDSVASIDSILRHLVVDQLTEQQYTKLEQAGSSADTRPGIESLYTDLPFINEERRYSGILGVLSRAIAENHSQDAMYSGAEWSKWRRAPSRSRVWFVRGGPGNGKSTVTQYVCQIHRSAILSQNPNISVSGRVGEVRAEIERRASASGFWPLAARVPIHIELRLYAHWYGMQPQEEPRGVLSYLAWRLTKGIEQPVLAGTLKRAFGQGRWLFAFDGLDEVPGDVKDALADEITKFVDSILVESGADAMTVCTSRPQGYSGQFDELRPTLIDLAKLNAEEAQACADPVLAIDRSKEEHDFYKETLREAIASPSIREIMTTPLQTHIMAVVIRDGGRPPERKWQLFSNFYQVIKKREANRNLADPKIAALLRGGDKLIKALHNRLGFELHFRAEKSSGAQTSIPRSDLREMIREIVTNLQDDDIDDTVRLLDEATTERLVLVNTPENGQMVRFDIRTLQEFFAAEYIYESANEADFADRLRSIATDSHWREVMHFLVSALVEQERRGELAQAVEVLSELDDSPSDQRRALARRLGIGGVLTTRLLREGVIESDKRIRGLFRKCLSSLMSSTDAYQLLASSPPQHSASWLAGVALDAISETVPSEHLGAALILPLVVKDGGVEEARAFEYIQNCDVATLGAILERVNSYNQNDDLNHLPVWFFSALLKRVIQADWQDMGQNVLWKIYSMLGDGYDRSAQAIRMLGVPEEAVNIIWFYFTDSHREQAEGRQGRVLAGLLTERIGAIPHLLNSFEWSDDLWATLEGVGGVVTACTLLAKASVQGCQDAVAKFDSIGQGAACLRVLPNDFCYLFLKHGEKEFSGSVARQLRHEHNGCYIELRLASRNSERQVDWNTVLDLYPSVCMMYLTDSEVSPVVMNFREWLESPGNWVKFYNRFEAKDTGYLPHFADLVAVMNVFPEQSERLKAIILKNGVRQPQFVAHRMWAGVELNLPRDAALLPHLVAHFSPKSLNDRFRIFDPRMPWHGALEKVREFLPDFAKLSAVWGGSGFDSEVFAAAGILYVALNPDPVNLDDAELKRLLSFYHDDISEWFVPCALQFITPAIRGGNEFARDFANNLLDISKSSMKARCASESVIADWREISLAPVNASLPTGIWAS